MRPTGFESLKMGHLAVGSGEDQCGCAEGLTRRDLRKLRIKIDIRTIKMAMLINSRTRPGCVEGTRPLMALLLITPQDE